MVTPTPTLPYITPTKEPPTDEITLKGLSEMDVAVAGWMLAVVLLICVVMNVYMFYVVGKNWRSFKQFPFSQSNILCMFLSAADLLFALMIGFPSALHLIFAWHFSQQEPKSMVFYAEYVTFFTLDYVFLLRMLIICTICVDRCIHIMKPLAYKYFVTHGKTIAISVLVWLVPFLVRTIPNIVLFILGGNQEKWMFCLAFQPNQDRGLSPLDVAEHNKNFSVPLTCQFYPSVNLEESDAQISQDVVQKLSIAELVLNYTVTLLSFAIICASNITILYIIVKRFTGRKQLVTNTDQTDTQRKKVRQSIQKNLLATFIMATVFLLTNLPCLILVIVRYVNTFSDMDRNLELLLYNYDIQLYMILCLFLSLLINPWLYALRMETIRRFFPCLRGNFTENLKQQLRTTRMTIATTLHLRTPSPTPEKAGTHSGTAQGTLSGTWADSHGLHPAGKPAAVMFRNSAVIHEPHGLEAGTSAVIHGGLEAGTEVVELDTAVAEGANTLCGVSD